MKVSYSEWLAVSLAYYVHSMSAESLHEIFAMEGAPEADLVSR